MTKVVYSTHFFSVTAIFRCSFTRHSAYHVKCVKTNNTHTHTSSSDRAMKAHKSRLSVNLSSCKQTTTTKHRLLFNQYTQSSHTQCTICTINSRNEHTPKRKGNKKYNQYSSFLYKNHIFNFYVTVHFVVG